VDCTAGGESLCGKHGVQGYPSIKVFKKDGNPKGEDYNGAREYNGLKTFVEKNLAGPECSLEDLEGCTPEEAKILTESAAMSVADRRVKITELETSIKEKKSKAKQLEAEAKKEQKELDIVKLGGEKPDKVEQLVGDAEFREKCESRTCIIAFLSHIMDGGAKQRNDELKIVDAVFKKAKGDNQPVSVMWSQGGDQFEMEEKLQLGFGFPAVVAINLKKERFGTFRGTFDKNGVTGFLTSMMTGKVPLVPTPKDLKWSKADPWDGKDAPKVEEDL